MISIKIDDRALRRTLSDLEKRQIPFALARTVTNLARKVQVEEKAALPTVLNRPTPFTQNAFRVTAATKATLTAQVYAMPIQARYLGPSEFGGMQIPAGPSNRAVLVPIDAAVNQYGNLPKGALARFKGRKDVFVGEVRTKSGRVVFGAWQRLNRSERARTVGRYKGRPIGGAVPGRLKLLVEFEAPREISPHLGFFERARKVVQTEMRAELQKQLAQAVRTAKK